MQLTKTAQALKDARDNEVPEEDFTDDVDELANCSSDSFGYALFDGGYIKPEDWVEGKDLVELQAAVAKVEEFKNLVEALRHEF